MNMRRYSVIIILAIAFSPASGQKSTYAQGVAMTAMKLWPDSFALEGDKVAKWRYDQGVILKGIEGIWKQTGNGEWFKYIQKSMDFYVQEDGSIKGYKPDEYNIDHVNNGRMLLLLYQVTGKDKYRKAADKLYAQLKTHPRTSEGNFWHKKIYPNQVWLDGLYMGQPFYAEYAKLFGDEKAFDDIAKQFMAIERHARDPKSGLLYHGWDESKQQQWADKKTGLSPNVWGRAMGWYGMALVDVLDYFPEKHWGRDSLQEILWRYARAICKVQDTTTGLWYDVMNKAGEPKNYFEASASSMFAYTLIKGVRLGYLPKIYAVNGTKAYTGIVKQFIKKEENGQVDLHGTVSVSGLGGSPYRDGSFAYYVSEPVVVNDPKGMGAFILAGNEFELLKKMNNGKHKTVLLDYYFNNEWRRDSTGRKVRYHYTWEDKSNSGFSMLGDVFTNNGFRIKSLEAAPTAEKLKGSDVYIIVDPDTEKETEKPNYMNETSASVIANWVKEGGVLILMANDSGNAELKKFNILASKFGIRFNEDHFNLVQGNKFEQGLVEIRGNNPVFNSSHNLYIKELATLQVSKPARTIVSKEGKNIIALSEYGKGYVLAIGDPWLYNEYVDGRKLPKEFDNYNAAQDLVRWIGF